MADAKQDKKKNLKTPKPEPSSMSLPPLSKPLIPKNLETPAPSSTSPPLSKTLNPKNRPVNSEHFIHRVKETGACRRCGNVFHKAKDCSAPVEYVSGPAPMPSFEKHNCFLQLMGTQDERAWHLSPASSCRICKYRDYFSTYEPVEEYIQFVGGAHEGRIIGVGTVVLKLVSGNTLVLRGVKHVPGMVKHVISPSLICSEMCLW